MDKTVKTNLQLLQGTNMSLECKVYTIITMLDERQISLGKARELLKSMGVFSKHWIEIDAEVTSLFEEVYKNTIYPIKP